MTKKIGFAAFGLTSLLALAACQTPGVESRPDVYGQSQVNTVQRGRVVTIISVSPTRINVDNSASKKTAQIAGGILGAALGSGLASGVGGSGWGGGLAAGAGGAAGGALLGGAIAGNNTLVNGVTVAYQDRAGGEALMSTQVGRVCEYKTGSALLVTTANNETRVQPNATCSKK
ncbi:hypothetical protein GT348_00625 [Aristophania vespae]|uniref:17 kDa surface antigen n=1 Tax=Aristophania vespae TaxID=2697033 RepID=A0A6P1N8Z7_9PROT|nr:hypothetical protein [Aristophania vespae]QHI95015.1 hypothetical protein GT348_00625 [Aristophania vespae]UMM64190.1 hypothetical protein DM15PD_11910 [Aristophania vespae]